MKKVAILGSTGHIAKNIIYGLSTKNYQLFLFARNTEAVKSFMTTEISSSENSSIHSFSEFSDHKYDVVINCVGIGDPGKLRRAGGSIFKLTEEFDNLILDYLELNKETLYINLSSGVAYGSNFNTPADQNKNALININNISSTDYYTISKINTETKHRAFSQFNIIDLRVFGFFSRFIDLKTPYFLSDIVNCVKSGSAFITGNSDMVRDYIDPKDFLNIIEKCIQAKDINDVFDVYSLEPISKFEMISFFEKHYNLKVSIEDNKVLTSVTGIKSNYYSLNKRAEILGYKPEFRSIDSINNELKEILKN
ncbi:Nucleoside-diphosphate-sugar epimerase [Paenibacillus algorifonticola]|uniref:Nucleoside-diphosphate-sugar epimerase n=1 Tax=Paenibacillus algorifonticola TaxID=684063 RepID=A0A1I2E044_9BACL|nr:NAD-dependent epimerase/dehydratase family protein [Paenibacillus algorifonticola]SFE86047.1 Nucleoside-diphosphate-sugar epimerase [Paenibacillus algorifonticola]